MASRKRWLVFTLIASSMLIAVVRVTAITGLVTPAIVVGGSMAESLCGHHLRFICPDCQFAFRCDADALPSVGELACPNCGTQEIDLNRAEPQRADRVWIDRWPYWWRTPARFEVVAVRQPDRPGEWAVKRVVALPGEHVTIRDGDLSVAPNNAPPCLVQKSLAQWRETAVLVHDERYAPTLHSQPSTDRHPTDRHFASRSLPSQQRPPLPRWAPRVLPSGWTKSNHAWCFAPPRSPPAATVVDDPLTQLDWLTFRNIVCHANPRHRQEEPVMDNDAYNQATSRTLHSVRDLALVIPARIGHAATFVIAIDDGADIWAVEFTGRDTTARLLRGMRVETRTTTRWSTLTTFSIPSPLADRNATIEFVRCDGQILVGIDGWSVARLACKADLRAAHPTSRPIAIGAANGPVKLGPPRVYRDLYYLGPATDESDWSRHLAPNEYLLLGDNPPISVDGRTWPAGSVTRESIIGKVIPLARQDQPKATSFHDVDRPTDP